MPIKILSVTRADDGGPAWHGRPVLETEGKPAMKKDNELVERVLEELRFEPRVDASRIGVTATDGAVTLSGYVHSYAEKFAANEAARALRDVKVVADDIEVRLPGDRRVDDTTIAERVAHVLDWNTSLPSGVIKATVRDGFVTLRGEMERHDQRKLVESQIRHVSGVKGIVNFVSLRPRPVSENIKRDIEAALQRNAHVEATGVRVTVDGGTVTLDGKVKAAYERDLVERAAWSSPGVREVVDELVLA